MSESKPSPSESPPVTDATAVGAVAGSPGRHAPDGLVITRWNLALSLSISLTVLAGAYSLVWQRMNAFHATQLNLVDRVSRVEVHMTFLQNEMVRSSGKRWRSSGRRCARASPRCARLIRAGRTDGATGAD